MSEPNTEKQIVPRRGRPRVDDPMVPVTTWVPTSIAQEIDRRSNRIGLSTSDVVRRCVILQLRRVDDE